MVNIKKQYIAALLAGFALTATLTACSTPATSVDPDADQSLDFLSSHPNTPQRIELARRQMGNAILVDVTIEFGVRKWRRTKQRGRQCQPCELAQRDLSAQRAKAIRHRKVVIADL